MKFTELEVQLLLDAVNFSLRDPFITHEVSMQQADLRNKLKGRNE